MESAAVLAQPVTLSPGETAEFSLSDNAVDAEQIAAKLGVPLDRGLLDWNR